MEHENWRCPKCQCGEFETDQFAATGGGLTKFFNIQNKKFHHSLSLIASISSISFTEGVGEKPCVWGFSCFYCPPVSAPKL